MRIMKGSSLDPRCPLGIIAFGTDEMKEVLLLDLRPCPDARENFPKKNSAEHSANENGKLRPRFRHVKAVKVERTPSLLNTANKLKRVYVISANEVNMPFAPDIKSFFRTLPASAITAVKLESSPMKTRRRITGIRAVDALMSKAQWAWAGPFLVQILNNEDGMPDVMLVSRLDDEDDEGSRVFILRRKNIDALGVSLPEIPIEEMGALRHLSRGSFCLVLDDLQKSN